MADTNVKILVEAIDNASNVLKNIGNNLETSLGKQSQTNVSALSGVMEGAVGTFGKFALTAGIVGVAIGGVALGVQKVVGAVDALMEASQAEQQVMAQTNAVLRSTGDISGASARQVVEIANAYQASTPIQHTYVQAAENMLLTFTAIGHSILPQVTGAVLDMATAMNGGAIPTEEELINTSIQVGKAFNDPVIGMTALRREGVTFSDAQKKVIEDLVNTGHGLEAQRLILAELNKEFGGSAAAALETYGGSMQNLHNAVTNLKESVGDALSPAVIALANDMAFNLTGASGTVQQSLVDLQSIVLALAGAFEILGEVAIGVGKAIYDALTGNFLDLGNVFNETAGNVASTFSLTQQRITDNAEKSYSEMSGAAKAFSDGQAIAQTKASDQAKKGMQDETQTYLSELAKRNAAFQQSIDDMIRSHLDKKNQLIQDLADENSKYQQDMAQRSADFKDKMDQMVSDHEDKTNSIKQQIQDEKDTFEQSLADEQASFKQAMDTMSDTHQSKVTKLQRDLDKERQVGSENNDAKYLDLKQEIDDENAAYAKQIAIKNTDEAKKLTDMQSADQKKLTQFQTELDKENAAYEKSVDKANLQYQKDTANQQAQHDAKTKSYQDQLDKENKLLNAHQAEVAKAEQDANDDEITRLEKTHAQENADALANHNKKMGDLASQGAAEGGAYGGAMKNALDEQHKKIEDAAATAGKTAGENFAKGIIDGAIKAGEGLITNFFKAAGDKIKSVAGQAGKAAGTVANVIGGDLGDILKGLGFKQAGGYIPGPIGAPIPIMAHGGEYVTSAGLTPKNSGGGSGGGGIVFNVNVGLYAGSETEKRNISKQLYASLLQVAQSQHKTVQEMMGG